MTKCIWWRRRTSLERGLVAITLLLLVICTALIIVNIITEDRLREVEDELESTCHTKECIAAAALLLEKMDPTIHPCDDFYQFACGNFLQKNTVPDDHYYRSTIQAMQDDIYITLKKLIEEPNAGDDTEAVVKVKRLYASCTNLSNIEDDSIGVLLQFLTEWGIGEWPILDPKWNKSNIDLEWRLAMLYAYSVYPFFSTYVSPDDRNSSVYLLHLYYGSPVLNTQYYLNQTEPDYARYMLSYRELISETVRLLDATESIAKRDIELLIEFETAFANISREDPFDTSNETSSFDEEFMFNKVNVSYLEEAIPEIKWNNLLGYIFDYTSVTMENNDLTIVLHCEKYLKNLVSLLNETSPRTVANYLTWRFVMKYMPYLDVHFRRLYYDFRREVPNTLSTERAFFARWKECIQLVSDGFGMALASLYVRQQFTDAKEQEVKDLISLTKEAFALITKRQTWLDDDTRSFCEEKVMAMTTKIGYPRYILDSKQLDSDYSGLEITEDHFLDNILKMNRYEVVKELSKMTRTVDKEKDWIVMPLIVNAYYEQPANTVVFPAGILRLPIFSLNRPKYLNFGMLGVIIGHEITHGFDTSGRKFDKTGNLTQWWPDEIIERYKEQAACIIDQYSQFPIEMVGQNINGNVTVDDNICDYAGLQQAYTAYQLHVKKNGKDPRLPGVAFKNNQIFFLQYAQIWCEVVSKEGFEKYTLDDHSPGRYRANVPLSNSPEFSEAFSCPVGSPMNPAKKCRLWG